MKYNYNFRYIECRRPRKNRFQLLFPGTLIILQNYPQFFISIKSGTFRLIFITESEKSRHCVVYSHFFSNITKYNTVTTSIVTVTNVEWSLNYYFSLNLGLQSFGTLSISEKKWINFRIKYTNTVGYRFVWDCSLFIVLFVRLLVFLLVNVS